MIDLQQQQRALAEFEAAAKSAVIAAKVAERELERYSYLAAPDYSRAKRDQLLATFREADYQAESLSWIASLIRKAIGNQEGTRT